MNFFETYRHHILTILTQLIQEGSLPEGLDLNRITTEPPRDPSHGDMSTNAAMVLAKPTGLNPRALAELLLPALQKLPFVSTVEIAGPGFINIRLENSFFLDLLKDILEVGDNFGASTLGRGEKINIEYVSANPTGPLHAGHGRVAVVADVLATLLQKVGYGVCREYYINDAGNQARILARSTYLRYQEALGIQIPEIPEGYYPGDYLKDVGKSIALRDGAKWLNQDESQWLEVFQTFAVEMMMKMIRTDLELIGIHQDVFTSEMALQKSGAVEDAVDSLQKKGLLYEGILEAPKGKVIEDWEPRPQLLFKSTEFGDDVDRPLKKFDGSWTYFAPDIAYHLNKFERGFSRMINVWGADHGGYVKRIRSAVKAVTDQKGDVDVIICQIVNFLDNGVPMKMSKRAGTFVTISDIVEQVGKDVFRFMMVSRKNDAHLEFDLQQVLAQSKDNPVFYVNYAYARVHSVKRMAGETFPRVDFSRAVLKTADFTQLQDPDELRLVQLLAGWPRQVEGAAEAHEPHRLTYYLYELAQQFHMLWNKGKEDALLRFILPENLEVTKARLALLQALADVIASGLKIFGVTPQEEMRG
ncbi:Arginine--tRNA ligase [Candidatus Bealeia paramacronuclearis]|uniref:Arginine--tRNA ligase n=1 Tax=Candidatus Bealeia paramacronuclearis TaxID=1921001 RepID=A0ABZ2C353_9PROT|nr:Arginine--tRNA ligase [Candidatus Bealeia paramacronuclearis]